MTQPDLTPPERKFNLLSCFGMGLIGALIYGVAWALYSELLSGNRTPLSPIFAFLVQLIRGLPNPNVDLPDTYGIPALMCGAIFWLVVFALPLIFAFNFLSRLYRQHRDRGKQEKFDRFMDLMKKDK